MYEVHRRRSSNSRTNYSKTAGPFRTLKEATDARQVNGDLVVYAHNHEVVCEDLSWLFEWEKKMDNGMGMGYLKAAIEGSYGIGHVLIPKDQRLP